MRCVRSAAAIGLASALAGCGLWGHPPVAAGDALTNRVWLDTGPDAAKGTIRAFLTDGTLVMTSCGEPYRLAPWRQVDDSTLVWDEDGRTIRATIATLGPDRLGLVLHLGDDDIARNYVAVRSPQVCPDLPR